MSTAEQWVEDVASALANPDDEPPTDPVELDGWFDYQLSQLADIKSEMERNQAVATARIAQIANWCDTENAVLQRKAEHIRRRMQEHAMTYDFGGKKSRNLPSGKFGWRKAPATLRVTDAEKLLESCKQLGIPPRVRETPDVQLVKHFIRNLGIQPDGCELVEGGETFYAEPVSASQGQ